MNKYKAKKIKGKTKQVHRLVMEEHLGRELKKEEVVHHIDGNHYNDIPEKRMILTPKEHAQIHILQGDIRSFGFYKTKKEVRASK